MHMNGTHLSASESSQWEATGRAQGCSRFRKTWDIGGTGKGPLSLEKGPTGEYLSLRMRLTPRMQFTETCYECFCRRRSGESKAREPLCRTRPGGWSCGWVCAMPLP